MELALAVVDRSVVTESLLLPMLLPAHVSGTERPVVVSLPLGVQASPSTSAVPRWQGAEGREWRGIADGECSAVSRTYTGARIPLVWQLSSAPVIAREHGVSRQRLRIGRPWPPHAGFLHTCLPAVKPSSAAIRSSRTLRMQASTPGVVTTGASLCIYKDPPLHAPQGMRRRSSCLAGDGSPVCLAHFRPASRSPRKLREEEISPSADLASRAR
jgi:hypothetical protein